MTFGGQPSVTVAAGAEAVSDTVPFPVAPLANVAVSMYFANTSTVATVHGVAASRT